MWKLTFAALGSAALAAGGVATASAASPVSSLRSLTAPQADPLVQKTHSAGEAERTLWARGYYDIVLERATLPYSFTACKRGERYHIHVDYYGDLRQVDPIGYCGRRYSAYDRYERYYARPQYERRVWRYQRWRDDY